MNNRTRFSYVLMILLLFGCTENSDTTNEFVTTSEVEYAKNFKFIREKNEVTLVLLDPESGKEERRFRQSDVKAQAQKIVALSSTHIGMLQKLGAATQVNGVSNMDYVYNPTVRKNHAAGKVLELGEENFIPLERLISSGVKLVIYSGFGKEFPHQKQLEKLGIICMANYDWRENHPLGKAEWIKVFGFLLDKEDEANQCFEAITAKYLSLQKEASKLKISKSLISGNIIGDLWYAPAGESYNAVLFRDANISYKYSETKGTGSVALSWEQVLMQNKESEYWINPGAESFKKLDALNSKAGFFRSYKHENVYCYSKNGNRFWEMSAIEPHKVLSDLIHICHPNNGLTNKTYFYSKLER